MRALVLTFCLGLAGWAGTKHYFHRPVLVYAHHPDLPIERYDAGRLGIPQPEHARIYLYAAYRYLEDRPFTRSEQDAFLRVWKARLDPWHPQDSRNDGNSDWEEVRGKILVPPMQRVRGEQIRIRKFAYAQACGDDAYRMAAKTLADRIRRYGAASREVRFWVEGQDLVFHACSLDKVRIPAPAPPDMPALLRADREYQIAAALFNSLDFDKAYEKFEAIAKDPDSPWRVWAPYLMGRTILWGARLTEDDKVYRTLLQQAERQFRSVLADPRLAVTHAAAERLYIRCLLATDPRRALERLGRRLLQSGGAVSREADLFMYLDGMDTLHSTPNSSAEKQPPLPQRPADPLSEWIFSFQSEGPEASKNSAARWRATKSRAWLFCAMVQTREGNGESREMVDAALALPTGPALRYQAARLLALDGEFVRAREVLDGVLAQLDGQPSARNQALALKAQLAGDVSEFARLAPLKVLLASSEMDHAEFESRARPDLNSIGDAAEARQLAALPRLDNGAETVFSRRLSLNILRDLALSADALPSHLQAELRLATWTRAVLLGRWDVAESVGPLVAQAYPEAAREMRTFLQSPGETEAAYVLLRLPGARPYMSRGYGRQTPVRSVDEWAKNWWYHFTEDEMHGIDLPYFAGWGRLVRTPQPAVLPRLPFLSPEDDAQAGLEWAQLRKRGERGLDWLAVRISGDIRQHPSRADAPQTLYRILKGADLIWWASMPDSEEPATGLGEAWRLLSTRYPGTPWFMEAQKIRMLPGR